MAKCKEWGLSKPVVLPSRFTGKLDGCFYLEAGIDTASRFELARKGVELVVAQFGDSLKLGFTKKIVDPRPFEQDDFDRPVQRRGVTLAPRLARLLVNLAGLTKGVVLDPFCGVGTILQEAMRLKHDVVGVDVQSGMVTASIKNLSWMASVLRAEPFRKERILRGDSRRLTHLLKDRRVDAVVTEPILLPLFKSRPSAEAQRLMSQALNTYGTVMHQISKMLHDGGRVVMVTPTIKTTGRMLTMNLDEHAESSGLKPAQLPEGSLPQPYDLLGSTRWVGRRVHIFQG
jgi:tRNA G10  N-methylase Trm11